MSTHGQQLAAHKSSANGAEIGNAMTKNQTMSPKAATNNDNKKKKKEKKRKEANIYINK